MGGFCLGIPLQGYAGPTAPPEPELRDLLLRSVDAADSFEHPYDAEVWLLDMSSRLSRIVPSDAERLELLRMVHAEARRAKLSPELVLAVIEVESRFDRFAISVAGAQGLMQIMPFWLKEIGHPQDNLFIVQTNLRMGCTILKYYLDREKGNLVQALARYNGSLGRLEYPGKVIEVLNKRWYRG
ncbi:lytic transglycosylase domain-containing protein [Sinimarinibacterium sp. CAU 1509]|uniref:lytic transglycosylase domain-containing protein n=1 Tax=Sinimarinibacterium sp. CAU 1509 TaxID=2562283 RepID=UPI0010AD908A|nr:lytic transglycosylase domain-containing protein [Sinimarinibacterium sp. CAU 1509]